MNSRLPFSAREAILLLASFVLGGVLVLVWFRSSFLVARDPDSKEIVSIEVKPNENLRTVSENLASKDVLKHWWSLYALAYIRGETEDFKLLVGEYRFSPSNTPREILEDLKAGKVHYYRVTIPEGSNLNDIAQHMARTPLVSLAEAETALHDRALMSELRIPGGTFEGYLFPETYNVTKPDDARTIIRRMAQEQQKQINEKIPNWKERAAQMNMVLHEVLTLASIIERETSVDSERPLVSSVFHNRLRIGMPLQSDPTVIYGIENFDGNLTRDHLRTQTPYNTYVNLGLPPTPICSPGIESIRAALEPADTAFLYFVSKGDGSHQFSATLREHNLAVQQYQKLQAAQ